ncbi:MAG: SsrA-binding protein SmpB [Clostridiales bacterium]|nr:SsrA-binding protein SmpB [Clostridiales bacterium]
MKIITTNKKAYHDYFVEETIEAGIALVGTEVKSIRAGAVNLKDCYVIIKNGEALLLGMHISPYDKGSFSNVDPERTRKLLLNKFEINRLRGKIEQKGFTLIPLKLYFKNSFIKVELGLCRGKQLHDKRAAIKERDEKRMVEKIMKEYNAR